MIKTGMHDSRKMVKSNKQSFDKKMSHDLYLILSEKRQFYKMPQEAFEHDLRTIFDAILKYAFTKEFGDLKTAKGDI